MSPVSGTHEPAGGGNFPRHPRLYFSEGRRSVAVPPPAVRTTQNENHCTIGSLFVPEHRQAVIHWKPFNEVGK